MATFSSTWTEAVSVRSSATLAASGSTTANIDLDTLGADRSDVQVAITLGSASSVTVEAFGSADSGTTVDTFSLLSYTSTANDTRTVSLTGPYIQLKMTNNDGANAVDNIVVKHAWRRWVSA